MTIPGYVKEIPVAGYLGLGGGVGGRTFKLPGGDEYWFHFAKGNPTSSTSNSGLRWPICIQVDSADNVYTAWTKWSSGGCIVTKHNKFGSVQWVKQIIAAAGDGATGSNTRWCGGIVYSPYNGYIIASVMDHQPSGSTSYGDIVHVAMDGSGSEQWAIRHDAEGVANNYNDSANNNSNSPFFSTKMGHGVNKGRWMFASRNTSEDFYIDLSMQLAHVKRDGYPTAAYATVEYMCGYQASDGASTGNGSYPYEGFGPFPISGSPYAPGNYSTNEVSVYTATSGSAADIMKFQNSYHNYYHHDLDTSSNYAGQSSKFGRVLNKYPQTTLSHSSFHGTAVNASQCIIAGQASFSDGSHGLSMCYVSSTSSMATASPTTLKTYYGLYMEDMHYSPGDSKLYMSFYTNDGWTHTGSPYKRHAIFCRRTYTSNYQNNGDSWVFNVEVKRAGTKIKSRGGLITEANGKCYMAVRFEDGWTNGILMVWDAENGPVAGTYGEGSGSEEIQIVISNASSYAGWLNGGGSTLFGMGWPTGQGYKQSPYIMGNQYYYPNTITESDDSSTTSLNDVDSVKNGNTSSDATWQGFSTEVIAIEQDD